MKQGQITILRVHFKLNSGTDGVTLQAKDLNRGLGEYGFSLIECACKENDEAVKAKFDMRSEIAL